MILNMLGRHFNTQRQQLDKLKHIADECNASIVAWSHIRSWVKYQLIIHCLVNIQCDSNFQDVKPMLQLQRLLLQELVEALGEQEGTPLVGIFAFFMLTQRI